MLELIPLLIIIFGGVYLYCYLTDPLWKSNKKSNSPKSEQDLLDELNAIEEKYKHAKQQRIDEMIRKKMEEVNRLNDDKVN